MFKHRSQPVLAGLTIALLMSPTIAQDTPVSPPERSLSDSAASYLRAKASEQAKFEQALRASGVSVGEVRSLVARYKARLKPSPSAAKSGRAPAIDDVFLTDIALELATLGFRASDLRNEQAASALFEAAAAKRNLTATREQIALLAQTVVEAEVTGYRMADKAGQSTGIMDARVVRTIKGSEGAGDVIAVGLATRRNANGTYSRPTSEYLPAVGTKVLLYLSRDAAKIWRAVGRAKDSDFVKLIEPVDLDGDLPASGTPDAIRL